MSAPQATNLDRRRSFITNARVLAGEDLAPRGGLTIELEGNRIKRIAPNESFTEPATGDAYVHDARGATVLPGLMNAHEHITWRRTSGTFAQRVINAPAGALIARGIGNCLISLLEGVTTIRDVGAKDDTALILKQLVEQGIIVGPRILSCGQFISTTGGHGYGVSRVADGPDEMRATVRQLITAGASLIKLMNSGDSNDLHLDPEVSQFNQDEIAVAFEEAHRVGLRTTAHAVGVDPIMAVVNGGVDCVEHASFLDERTAEILAERRIPIVPTLMELEGEIRYGADMGRPAAEIEGAKRVQPRTWESLRTAARAGVVIGAGVDPLGDLFEELEMLCRVALTPAEALKAATSVNADILGISEDVGVVDEGKLADLVVVDGKPDEQISDLRRLQLVMKDGVAYEPAALRQAIGQTLVVYDQPRGPGEDSTAAAITMEPVAS